MLQQRDFGSRIALLREVCDGLLNSVCRRKCAGAVRCGDTLVVVLVLRVRAAGGVLRGRACSRSGLSTEKAVGPELRRRHFVLILKDDRGVVVTVRTSTSMSS